MIQKVISFGIFMLIENTIILVLIADLARRVSIKLWHIRHPHLYWKSGMIFLAYLLCVFLFNLSEAYTCFVNYIINKNPIPTPTVVARVFSRSLILAAKGLLWYYSVNGGFTLFKNK